MKTIIAENAVEAYALKNFVRDVNESKGGLSEKITFDYSLSN